MLAVVMVAMAACGGGAEPGAELPTDDRRRAAALWTTSDIGFRGLARVRLRPEYPELSRNRGTTGVAVAEVAATEEGRVDRVDILEAPDAHIGDAVAGALAQWEIEPPVDDDGQPIRLGAKLFFYFVLDDGEGFVRSPEEMLRESGRPASDRQASPAP